MLIKGMKALSYEERLWELGFFSLAKWRLQGVLILTFQNLKETGKEGQDYFQEHVVTGQGGMGSNWNRVGLD